MDMRGRLRDAIPEIIVAIDISASMSDSEFHKTLIEILAITRDRANKIKVIECDDNIRNGATKFSPVFEYIRENRLSDRVLVYFTDGVGEKELTVKPTVRNVIWVLTGEDDLSLREKFGIIKKIDGKTDKGEGGSAALEMIRGVIHDWAR